MLTLVQTEVKILARSGKILILLMRNRKQATGKTNQWRSCFDMFMKPRRACEECVLQYEQSWPGWSALTITVRRADRLHHRVMRTFRWRSSAVCDPLITSVLSCVTWPLPRTLRSHFHISIQASSKLIR